MRKRKQIDGHELQALWNVVKKGGDTVIKDFENVFQEVRIEGKKLKSSAGHYTDSSLILYSGNKL